ncbi:hypothetical protein [Rahnella sp. ChDrAdgB13]|uniref:hypothetical protein n=1 Tax=Rahnella sp. ChDrAdgB13 TaxID=1850581 RepID=UPI001AD884C0|nr:hypothetical protein [Rahnella sp. ChDrAdgB13]
MKPSKRRIENLYEDAEAIFLISKMLLNNFQNDPDADEDGTYGGVIKGIFNLSNQLQIDLFAIKQDMKDE